MISNESWNASGYLPPKRPVVACIELFYPYSQASRTVSIYVEIRKGRTTSGVMLVNEGP